jgi:hypothetical protein
MQKIRRCLMLSRFAALSLLVAVLWLAPAHAAQVAVTVEKLTLGEGFIAEPEFVQLSGSQTAADVIRGFLSAKFPGVEAYSYNGSGAYFYISGIYDPSRGGLLEEKENGSDSGWMITVNNVFIGTSAGLHNLSDGDVMRWQYTKRKGDLGTDAEVLGENTLANKDQLIWKVAEIKAAGSQSSYGGLYNNALSVLKNLNASRSAVNSALAALNGVDSGADSGSSPGYDPGEAPDEGTPSGGGSDSNTGTDPGPDQGLDSDEPDASTASTDVTPGKDPVTDPDPGTDTGIGDGTSDSGGVQGIAVTEPVFTPPAGIDAGSAVSTVSASNLANLGLGVPVSESGGIAAISAGAFADGLGEGAASAIDVEKPITTLPPFSAGVAEGGTALVSFKVSLDSYAGGTMGEIEVLKMKIGGSVVRLEPAPSAGGVYAGSFVWTDEEGRDISSSSKVTAGRDYFLSVAIEDNSDYDLDHETPDTIVDPLALAVKKAEAANAGPKEGSGGGGCDAGAGGLVLAVLCAVKFARRRGV